jgi:hypothetical protein
MTVPPRSVFAAAARDWVADGHQEWDAPHCFQTLHMDGEQLVCRTYACIMHDVSPPEYPRVMAGIAAEQQQKDPGDPAYAYLLQIESFGVSEPGPEASAAERAAYHDARRNRTFHLMPGTVEACTAWVADIHGRLWAATKTRQHPEHIHEVFYPPGRAPGGGAIRGLLAVAQLAGVAYHGIPGTWPGGVN